MAYPPDCCPQDILVIRELLKETDLTTGGSDGYQIVLTHLLVNKIKQHFARAADTVEREMAVVKKKNNGALPE